MNAISNVIRAISNRVSTRREYNTNCPACLDPLREYIQPPCGHRVDVECVRVAIAMANNPENARLKTKCWSCRAQLNYTTLLPENRAKLLEDRANKIKRIFNQGYRISPKVIANLFRIATTIAMIYATSIYSPKLPVQVDSKTVEYTPDGFFLKSMFGGIGATVVRAVTDYYSLDNEVDNDRYNTGNTPEDRIVGSIAVVTCIAVVNGVAVTTFYSFSEHDSPVGGLLAGWVSLYCASAVLATGRMGNFLGRLRPIRCLTGACCAAPMCINEVRKSIGNYLRT